MTKNRFIRALPFLMVFSFVGVPAQAQSGGDIGRQMEREYGVVSPSAPEGRMLERVTERIVTAFNQNPRYQNFSLRSATLLGGRSEKGDRMVNAFALPDGRIYVTLGLMRALENSRRPEDELAFVVGHEVTHVVEKHGQSQSNKAVQAGILAILLGAVTKSDAVSTIAGLGANAYVSKFSRQDEYKADKGGLWAMERAGYDPRAAEDMLARLGSAGEDSNRLVNGWFGSHPLTGNRIDRVRQMNEDLAVGRDVYSRNHGVEGVNQAAPKKKNTRKKRNRR